MTYVNKILRVAKKETKTRDEQFIKLQEEIGEIAVAILHSRGLKNTSKTKKEINDNILEEICDSIIVLYSLASAYKFTKKDIDKMISKKILKWEARFKKNG